MTEDSGQRFITGCGSGGIIPDLEQLGFADMMLWEGAWTERRGREDGSGTAGVDCPEVSQEAELRNGVGGSRWRNDVLFHMGSNVPRKGEMVTWTERGPAEPVTSGGQDHATPLPERDVFWTGRGRVCCVTGRGGARGAWAPQAWESMGLRPCRPHGLGRVMPRRCFLVPKKLHLLRILNVLIRSTTLLTLPVDCPKIPPCNCRLYAPYVT